MDPFTLAYTLEEHAWATALIAVGSKSICRNVSYLTIDPLGELASALIDLIWPQEVTYFVVNRSISEELLSGLQGRHVVWADEPGGVRWTLRTQETNSLLVRIDTLRDTQAGSEVAATFEGSCFLRDVVDATVQCMESVLLQHGIVGYRGHWSRGDISLSRYLMLKRWLANEHLTREEALASTWATDIAQLAALSRA